MNYCSHLKYKYENKEIIRIFFYSFAQLPLVRETMKSKKYILCHLRKDIMSVLVRSKKYPLPRY